MGGGALGPTDGPIACLEATSPFMAALNSGSLNYLRSLTDIYLYVDMHRMRAISAKGRKYVFI